MLSAMQGLALLVLQVCIALSVNMAVTAASHVNAYL